MLQWLYDLLWGNQAAPVNVAPVQAVAQQQPQPLVVNVIPPPLPFPVVNAPIDPAEERRRRELQAFLAELQRREQLVGGHVGARHHPDLTNQQLQDRLTTGLDAQGVVAVTSGISSAFASQELFRETLKSVEDLLNTGLEKTRTYLRENLKAYRDARTAAEQAQRALLPNTIAGGHALMVALKDAKNDLAAAVGVTQQGAMQRNQFLLPVEMVEGPVIAKRNQWANLLKREYLIQLFPRYRITLFHYKTIGRGYRGTSPRLATVQGQQITVYDQVQPFQAPSDHTFTLLVVKGQHDLRLTRPHNAQTWGLITHFPTDTREESISGAQ